MAGGVVGNCGAVCLAWAGRSNLMLAARTIRLLRRHVHASKALVARRSVGVKPWWWRPSLGPKAAWTLKATVEAR